MTDIGDNLSIDIFILMVLTFFAYAILLWHRREMKRIENGSDVRDAMKAAEKKLSEIRQIVD